MTVVAMWCRHKGDNIIGIDGHLPWCIPSDSKRFYDVISERTVVCGRATYESLPNLTLDGSRIFVMSSNSEYEVSNPKWHKVITKQKELDDLEEDVYVAGGAEIYKLFLTGKEKLKPHIIVDCVFEGELSSADGKIVDISDSVALMEKKYRKITPDYCLDNVAASIWIKKGDFVEQSELKRIVKILEENAVLR